MIASNISYAEERKRGFFKQVVLSLFYTLVGIIGYVCVLALAVAVPFILQLAGVAGAAGAAEIVTLIGRWVLLWLSLVGVLSALYRHVPERRPPKWRWTLYGAMIAASLCLLPGC